MSEKELQFLQKKIIQLEQEAASIKELELKLLNKQNNFNTVNMESKVENTSEIEHNQADSFTKEIDTTELGKKVVIIGVMGTQAHIGVTHMSIQIANILRNNGLKVALAEFNTSGAFDYIRGECMPQANSDIYFEYHSLNFYPNSDLVILDKIFMSNYEFIIIDFGIFNNNCHKNLFLRCDIKIIVSGSKSWELRALDEIFASIKNRQLENYHYCFNFTPNDMLKKIQTGMSDLNNIYFLGYNSDLFSFVNPTVEAILKEYLPISQPTLKTKKFTLRRNSK